MQRFRRTTLTLLILICSSVIPNLSYAFERGIYINHSTMENTRYLKHLIKRAKQVGIGTFIIDLARITKRYRNNIALVRRNGIRYVTRIVVFPRGGKHSQIISTQYWKRRYRLVQTALALGADAIQLDYIRYHVGQRPSRQNARNVNTVIKWFRKKIDHSGANLQVAVFGVTSFGESKAIGQNIVMFANNIETLCPMLYPSHYEPYRYHSKRPYETVLKSIKAIHQRFKLRPPRKIPVRLVPYIEVANYRYRLSGMDRIKYIHAQIRAVRDGNSDGWYAWSPNNHYEYLFRTLMHFK